MNIVQFRWDDPETHITYIIGQYPIDWKFSAGDIFDFWGGPNTVTNVNVHCYLEEDGHIAVHQVVTVNPLWYRPDLGLTPQEVWKNAVPINKYTNESTK